MGNAENVGKLIEVCEKILADDINLSGQRCHLCQLWRIDLRKAIDAYVNVQAEPQFMDIKTRQGISALIFGCEDMLVHAHEPHCDCFNPAIQQDSTLCDCRKRELRRAISGLVKDTELQVDVAVLDSEETAEMLGFEKLFGICSEITAAYHNDLYTSLKYLICEQLQPYLKSLQLLAVDLEMDENSKKILSKLLFIGEEIHRTGRAAETNKWLSITRELMAIVDDLKKLQPEPQVNEMGLDSQQTVQLIEAVSLVNVCKDISNAYENDQLMTVSRLITTKLQPVLADIEDSMSKVAAGATIPEVKTELRQYKSLNGRLTLVENFEDGCPERVSKRMQPGDTWYDRLLT